MSSGSFQSLLVFLAPLKGLSAYLMHWFSSLDAVHALTSFLWSWLSEGQRQIMEGTWLQTHGAALGFRCGSSSLQSGVSAKVSPMAVGTGWLSLMALEAQKKCWSSSHHLSLPQDGILSMPHQMTTPPPLGSAVWLREASDLPIPWAGGSVDGHWLWPSGPCHGQAATSRARPALMFNCWARGDLSCHNKQVLKIGSKMRVKSIAHRTDGFGANTGHGQVLVGNWTERPCSGCGPCMTP